MSQIRKILNNNNNITTYNISHNKIQRNKINNNQSLAKLRKARRKGMRLTYRYACHCSNTTTPDQNTTSHWSLIYPIHREKGVARIGNQLVLVLTYLSIFTLFPPFPLSR